MGKGSTRQKAVGEGAMTEWRNERPPHTRASVRKREVEICVQGSHD